MREMQCQQYKKLLNNSQTEPAQLTVDHINENHVFKNIACSIAYASIGTDFFFILPL